MSKRRRKPIDPRGHAETRGKVPAVVACMACTMERLKSQPWPKECAAAKKAEAA